MAKASLLLVRAEIGLSCSDVPPVMLGAKKHKVKTLDGPSDMKRHLQRGKEQLERDQYKDGMVGDSTQHTVTVMRHLYSTTSEKTC